VVCDCASRRLQLNAAKTELIWFGSRAALCNPSVESVVVPPADVVRDLGVLLDSELTTKPHVNKLVSTCFCHIRQLRQLKHYVDCSVMQQLVSAYIPSRLRAGSSMRLVNGEAEASGPRPRYGPGPLGIKKISHHFGPEIFISVSWLVTAAVRCNFLCCRG